MKNWKKMMFLLTSGMLSLLYFSTAQAQKTVFTGSWKLNEAKSELGNFGGRGTATAITVQQTADSMVIARTNPGFNGGQPVTNTITLTFDGKVTETEGPRGGKRKYSAKWAADGKSMVISAVISMERDGQTFEFNSTETWTMGAEGELIVATTMTTPRGENSTRAVYAK